MIDKVAEALRRQATMSWWDPAPELPGGRRHYCWCRSRPEWAYPASARWAEYEHEVRCAEARAVWDEYEVWVILFEEFDK